jgi:hypothetical protein
MIAPLVGLRNPPTVFRLVGSRDEVEVELRAPEPTGLGYFSADDGLFDSGRCYY